MGKGNREGKVRVQLEESYNDCLVPLCDHFRADQKLKPVIKGIVPMPLKH